MQLSKYFVLAEMLASQTAGRKGIDNSPTAEHLENLRDTCSQADHVRESLGHPMLVLSGYRSAKLNAVVGGSKTSSHMQGYAIDFICPGFGSVDKVFDYLKRELLAEGIQYDQLILEFPGASNAWIHIGFNPKMRNQNLVYNGQYSPA